MHLQLVIGGLVSLANIAIHAIVMDVVITLSRAEGKRLAPGRLSLARIMVVAVSILMLAHILEVFVWSLSYLMVGITPVENGVVYFAFVNFTTLGYGDVTPVRGWRLLGPVTAMNGILLFGWSTAVIFEVLRRSLAVIDARQGGARRQTVEAGT
jgi:hypothetical protein